MDNYIKMCGRPVPPKPEAVTPVHLQKMWDRISAAFADKQDVLRLAKGLQELEKQMLVVKQEQAALSCDDPVENWIVVDHTDECGNKTAVYNDSTNAVSAAAAAMIIKEIRNELNKKKHSVVIVPAVDKEGYPMVANVEYNTIYLTPSNDGGRDSSWTEWIAVPRSKVNCTTYPYRWERIGEPKLNLSWVRNNFDAVNGALKQLNNKLNNKSKQLADHILNKAIKPLNELVNYIQSDEFFAGVAANLPLANISTDGLMSSASFSLLSMLALWAQNDHKTMGGGALGPDVVIKLLDKAGCPVNDLKEIWGHNDNPVLDGF